MDGHPMTNPTLPAVRPAPPPAPSHPEDGPLYVEVSALLTPHLTGIGRFVARLVEALSRLVPLRLVTTVSGTNTRHTVLSTALEPGEEVAVPAGDLPPADGDVGRWVGRLLRRPRRRHDARLAARSPGLYTLLRPRGRHFRRELGILYDFTPALVPWAHVPSTCEHFGIFFSETVGRCDKVLAISGATRADAAWLSAARPEDVVAAYPGPSLCVGRHASGRPVARAGNVVLVVSTLEPRKNGHFLLDWFVNTPVLGPDVELWWVGPAGWHREHAALRRRAGRRVKFLGVVPDAELCELYRRAAFTVYPSLYEGFGFPVLDSLWHGTPVLCGFHSSLPEFAGAGVCYFDACDPASLDEACRELLADGPGPVWREDLAGRFSWDRLAQTVLCLC